MKERRSTTVDFKSVHQLQFIIHGSLKPSRILLHSLEGFGTISSIHVELECLKLWLAHAQFSHLATLGTGYVTHVTLETRLPLVFQRATLKNCWGRGWGGWDISTYLQEWKRAYLEEMLPLKNHQCEGPMMKLNPTLNDWLCRKAELHSEAQS